MKRGAGLTVTVAAFITTLFFVTFSGFVQAEELDYDWIGTELSDAKLFSAGAYDPRSAHPYCEAGERYRYILNPEYTLYNGQDRYLAQKVTSSCWRNAGGWTFGLVSGVGQVFLRDGTSIGFMNNGSQEEFRGGYLVRTSNYSSSSLEHAKRLTFVQNPNYTIATYSNGQQIQFNYDQANTWSPADGAGDQRVYAYGFSMNDKWLVLQGASGMYRVNVDTRETTLFSYPRPVSGNGTSYDHDISVTDDGRYAVLSLGGNQGGSTSVVVYDIESCRSDGFTLQTDSPECRKRDIKSALGFGSTNQKPVDLYFTPKGNELIYIKYELDALGTAGYAKHVLRSGADMESTDYIALGDSFSSGEGELDGASWYREGTDRDGERYAWSNTGIDGYPYDAEVCHQSKRSYPYLLAGGVGYSGEYTNVTCSGAVIGDVLGWNTLGRSIYLGHGSRLQSLIDSQIKAVQAQAVLDLFPGRAAQIEFVSRYQPEVVTVGIGGNDLGFASKLKACIVPELTCTESRELRAASGYEIRGMYQKYINLFRRLRATSMTSKLYAVGYPQFLSASQGCQQISVWLDDYEKRYIRESVSYLNDVIEAAAVNSGVVYLDIEDALQGRQLCDSVYSDAVNSVVHGNDQGGIHDRLNFIGNESFHPTNIGHQLIAEAIKRQLGEQGLMGYEGCPEGCPTRAIPEVPAYFVDGSSRYDATLVTRMIDSTSDVMNDGIAFVDFTKNAVIDTSRRVYDSAVNSVTFRPSTTVDVTFFSQPVVAGTMPVDEAGVVKGSVPIPPSLPYGLHTLALTGVSETGEKMMMYKRLYVYKTLDDMDGNGILDTSQNCGVLIPALDQDQDRDGIDDACDGYMNPDATPPVVTGTLRVAPNEDGWIKEDSVIDWIALDDRDGSGVLQPEPTIVNVEDVHEYQSRHVCDSSENCANGSMPVKLDKSAPILGEVSWSLNPKRTNESSMMNVAVSDAHSGISTVEYYIGDTDPGRGNGAPMTIRDGVAVIENSTDYPTGVYKISVRARDYAGNWSEPTLGYLVVYDPTSGAKIRGSRSFDVSTVNGYGFPWLSSAPTKATFGMSVRYDASGQLVRQSDFQLRYAVGTECKRTACHVFELNATTIDWLTLSGVNKAEGIFHGRGLMKLDGIEERVSFIVRGVDGVLLDNGADDMVSIEIYQEGISVPRMMLKNVAVGRGNVKVSER